MTTPFLKTILAVLRKDLLAELRSREIIGAMALYALLSVLVFSFALQLNLTVRREAVSGILWVTVTFAVVLGFNRSSATERESGSFDALLVAPVSRGAIYLGKALSNYVFALAVGLILLPVMTVLFNVRLTHPGAVLALVLGALGLSVTGTLLSMMTVQTRTRETLLPIVMLPVALPLLLAAVSATTRIINNEPSAEWAGWLQLIGVIDTLYFALCYLLFDYVVEE
ncbi:MAG: heme exporter protein CcmB [Chloroflexota bacterium]